MSRRLWILVFVAAGVVAAFVVFDLGMAYSAHTTVP